MLGIFGGSVVSGSEFKGLAGLRICGFRGCWGFRGFGFREKPRVEAVRASWTQGSRAYTDCSVGTRGGLRALGFDGCGAFGFRDGPLGFTSQSLSIGGLRAFGLVPGFIASFLQGSLEGPPKP